MSGDGGTAFPTGIWAKVGDKVARRLVSVMALITTLDRNDNHRSP